MYDSVGTLLGNPRAIYDSAGNETLAYTECDVFVMPRSVYSSEFYNAAQAGLHPSITFEISNRADYHGERLIRWQGTVYNVIRADWVSQRDKLSLVCEERVHNG